MDVLVITPVKDSLETTRKTIEAIQNSDSDHEYIIFNDFSSVETRKFLEETQKESNFNLFNLEDITQTPSPNYKLILQTARLKALSEGKPLLIIESDVIIQKTTISQLLTISRQLKKPGLIGAITTDLEGKINFPYGYIEANSESVIITKRSVSFCCTLLSVEFLAEYDFARLPDSKDWFDIYISHQSRKSGFNNYIIKEIPVIHLPHSSRPWKQLKYTHPLKYYFYKLTTRRDRI